MEELIERWLERTVSVKPRVTMCEKPHDIQHSRVLSVSWASGKKTKLILDQGAGYWKPRTPYRDQTSFNFNARVEAQETRMSEQYQGTHMVNGGVWNTLFYIVSE
jgi:hypothetical protein